jgi:ribosome-binding ATPase YchF (GTP1/OBG family)
VYLRLVAGVVAAMVVAAMVGSLQAARAAGEVRMEGKDYLMADGDVVEFRFNV